MQPVKLKFIASLFAAAVAGCAGSGAGLDANGNPGPAGAVGNKPLTADFQSIQDHVFTPICSVCHNGGSAPQGLQLDAAHSYDLLVGVPSSEQPALKRIDPSSPDTSYLVLKIQGSPGISGVRMPANGPPYLPQSTIDVIRQWITDGAQRGTTTKGASSTLSSQLSFAVTMTSPDDRAVAALAVPRVVVAFNSEIDQTLLDNRTVMLERLDPLSNAGAPLPASIAVPTGNSAAIVITPTAALQAGTYRVTLAAPLADVSARALGSDFTFSFTVDALQ